MVIIQFQLAGLLFNLPLEIKSYLPMKKWQIREYRIGKEGIGFWSGLSRSLITVSIVHPESIGDQVLFTLKKQKKIYREMASKE